METSASFEARSAPLLHPTFSGECPRRGGGPPLSVGGPARRAEPLLRAWCKREGLPRERSSARTCSQNSALLSK